MWQYEGEELEVICARERTVTQADNHKEMCWEGHSSIDVHVSGERKEEYKCIVTIYYKLLHCFVDTESMNPILTLHGQRIRSFNCL